MLLALSILWALDSLNSVSIQPAIYRSKGVGGMTGWFVVVLGVLTLWGLWINFATGLLLSVSRLPVRCFHFVVIGPVYLTLVYLSKWPYTASQFWGDELRGSELIVTCGVNVFFMGVGRLVTLVAVPKTKAYP